MEARKDARSGTQLARKLMDVFWDKDTLAKSTLTPRSKFQYQQLDPKTIKAIEGVLNYGYRYVVLNEMFVVCVGLNCMFQKHAMYNDLNIVSLYLIFLNFKNSSMHVATSNL